MENTSLFDDVLKNEELVRYANRFVQEPMFLTTLFPEQQKATLDLRIFKGGFRAPVTAHVHAFDSETELASREGGKWDTAQMLLVKRQFRLDEELLIRLSQTTSDAIKQEIKNDIYNDTDALLKSIAVRFEALRGEVLQSGKARIKENGVDVTIDYHAPSQNQVTGTWSSPDSKPLDDIEKWMDTVETTSGIRPTRVLTRRKVARQLLANESVRKAVYGTDSDRLLSLNTWNSFASSEGLPTITTYEGWYRDETPSGKKVNKYYIDEDKFILLPPDIIGNTFYGPTADAIELSRDPGIQVQQTGHIALTTYRKADSPSKFIKATATGLPTAPYLDEVGVATIS